MWNIFKTAMLLAVLTVMLVLIGSAFGGRQGMQMAFVLALLMNLASYWFSDKIVLAMYGAQPIDEAQAPGLYAIVRRLTTRAGLPMPRVYLIPTDTPNAFATGRNPHHAAVAVTEGIMRILNDEELERANEVAPMAANPSTAPLFIVNPLGRNVLMRLFSTHPPIEERIARLRAMRI